MGRLLDPIGPPGLEPGSAVAFTLSKFIEGTDQNRMKNVSLQPKIWHSKKSRTHPSTQPLIAGQKRTVQRLKGGHGADSRSILRWCSRSRPKPWGRGPARPRRVRVSCSAPAAHRTSNGYRMRAKHVFWPWDNL